MHHIYNILSTRLVVQQCHKDLGILFSLDLTWEQHYKHILSKAYAELWAYYAVLSANYIHPRSRRLSTLLW